MAGLQWAARRMGPITATLDVSYRSFTGAPSEEKGDSFINAFSGLAIAQLKSLTCFTYSPFEYLEEDDAAKAFTGWVLEHAPRC